MDLPFLNVVWLWFAKAGRKVHPNQEFVLVQKMQQRF